LAIKRNREREIAKRLTVTQDAQAITKIFNVGLLGLIHQHIERIRLSGVDSWHRLMRDYDNWFRL
jgi:hypothetical protein